jgi:anti-sigma factor RsiW
MTCDDVRTRLLDYQRGRLPLPAQAEVRTHLDACADCARAEIGEQELTSGRVHRLPP